MKDLFELTNNVYLNKRYTVTTYSPLLLVEKVHNDCSIIDAMNICEEFAEKYSYYEIRVSDNQTGEILYEQKASQGDMPKSTVVYTYNVVFDHLAELLEKEMDF
jgi:hypothetical protein